MGDSSKWSIDNNGYYLTNYIYTPPRTSPARSESLMSNDTHPISYTITFDEPTDVLIDYAVGMMYAGAALNPAAGLYCSYGNIVKDNFEVDSLGEASEIYTVTANSIELTRRTKELTNITELNIWTQGRPVLWIDHILVKDLNW